MVDSSEERTGMHRMSLSSCLQSDTFSDLRRKNVSGLCDDWAWLLTVLSKSADLSSSDWKITHRKAEEKSVL